MPRADDAPVGHLALVQGSSAVGAVIVERVKAVGVAHDHHVDLAGPHAYGPALGQLLLGHGGGPLAGALREDRLVDPHALHEREVPAEMSAHGHGARAGESEQPPALPAAPGQVRGREQPEGGDIRRGVHEAGTAHAVAGHLRVGPVRVAARGGGKGGEDPYGHEPAGGGARVAAADQVEHDGAGPGADRHVGEQRMSRVPERGAAEHVLDRSRGQDRPHGLGHALRGRVERLESSGGGGEAMQRVGHPKPLPAGGADHAEMWFPG